MSELNSPSLRNSRRIIGLTGGIGMGKTTVSDYLADTYHLPVLDADLYAREAVHADSPILTKIAERYGPSILLPNGDLDRVRLGSIVFNSSAERFWLERQIHPFVRDRIETALRGADLQNQPILILSIPLLFEARMTDLVNEIWVVYCSQAQQVERLMQRQIQQGDRAYQLLEAEVRARITSQMAIERKMQYADVVLDNSTTVEQLLHQVDEALGQSRLQRTAPS